MNNHKLKKQCKLRRSAHTWHLVTNHQNMLYMLAAGMVMGPAGFRGKHYTDSLDVFPGCIPLFRDKNKTKCYIPTDAVQQAISERKHLLPCIASFDLSELIGPAFRLKRDGCFRKVESTTERRLPNDIAQVLRAPLPISLLRCIVFRSDADRQAFETAAREVANIKLPDFMIHVDESLFLTEQKITWPPPASQQGSLIKTNDHPQCHDTSMWRAQAIGGLLAVLYHTANRSDLSLAVYHLATGTASNNDNALIQKSPVLREFHAWLYGAVGEHADELATIYWGAADALIHAMSKESQKASIDIVLNYLKAAHERLQKQEFKNALEQLIVDMHECLGLGGRTISELFKYHKGPLSRSLLLFCLREHTMDLLEFFHPMLGDTDYILASILFGVRDGWLRLPKDLRDPFLSDYVSYRMADYEHQRRKSQLAFTSPPPPPVPLRAYFSTSGREWSRKQKEIALELVDKCGWNDCIQTHITPRTGDVLDDIESNGSQIKVRGRVSVTEEVDSTLFLHRLGKWPLVPFQIQTEIRSAFECEEDTGRQRDEGGRP